MSKYNETELAKMFANQNQELRNDIEHRSLNDDKKLKAYIDATKSVMGGLDAFMYNNTQFRAAYNAECERTNNQKYKIGYDFLAMNAEDSSYIDSTRKYEGRALDTASNPGGLNIIQTTLSDTIIHKAEATGQILSLLGKDTVPYGDIEYPRLTAKAEGQFIDETTTAWTDISPNTYEAATIGITKVKFTPRDFGLNAIYTQRLLKKVSPAAVAFFRDYESKGLTRGLERQALRGNGIAPNAQGILGIATSVIFAGDAYDTFCDAVGILGAADTDNITAVMSRKTWARFKKLRVLNQSYQDIIDPVNLRIDDIKVILSNNINASEATAGNIILGDFNHYMMVNSGGLDTIEDKFSAGDTRKVKVYHTMQVDLGAVIPSSFATYSLTY